MTTRTLGGALKSVSPNLSVASCTAWVTALEAPMQSSGITTARRVAAFLGQIAVESGGFTAVEEDLDYSAERLCAVWPERFTFNGSLAVGCAYHPENLANIVYANRMGNGDEDTGDGYRFRGRGLIQITGRANYEAFAKADARAADPDWLKTPTGAAVSACWFWTTHKLNALADGWELTAISRAINGGTDALQGRIELSNTAYKWLS